MWYLPQMFHTTGWYEEPSKTTLYCVIAIQVRALASCFIFFWGGGGHLTNLPRYAGFNFFFVAVAVAAFPPISAEKSGGDFSLKWGAFALSPQARALRVLKMFQNTEYFEGPSNTIYSGNSSVIPEQYFAQLSQRNGVHHQSHERIHKIKAIQVWYFE